MLIASTILKWNDAAVWALSVVAAGARVKPPSEADSPVPLYIGSDSLIPIPPMARADALAEAVALMFIPGMPEEDAAGVEVLEQAASADAAAAAITAADSRRA